MNGTLKRKCMSRRGVGTKRWKWKIYYALVECELIEALSDPRKQNMITDDEE